MSVYEYVETSLWSDGPFLALRPPARLLYVWSFTNPRNTLIGIYKVARDQMKVETGLSPKLLNQSLEECADARLLFYDETYAFVRARVKHLQGKSPNTAKGIRRELLKLDQRHQYTQAFLFLYQNSDWADLNTLLGGFDVPQTNPLGRGFEGLRAVS